MSDWPKPKALTLERHVLEMQTSVGQQLAEKELIESLERNLEAPGLPITYTNLA